MKLTDDSARVTTDLVTAILAGLSITLEARRAEVGLAQARAEALAAVSLAAEAVYFYLGSDISKLDEVIVASTMRRLVGAYMPTFAMSDAAQDDLLTLLDANDNGATGGSGTTH